MQFSNSHILRISNFYFLLALAVFGGAVVYGVLQYQTFRAEKQAVSDNEAHRTEQTVLLDQSQKTYKLLAEKRAGKQKEFEKAINGILPPDENYTELTQHLDDYFAANDRQGNPILQNSLNFQKGASVEGFSGISVLPFSMNLEGSRGNFLKFLEFVENSGSLDLGTRLMEINSIDFNFTEGGELVKDLQQKISFNVNMNAYYRTPKVKR